MTKTSVRIRKCSKVDTSVESLGQTIVRSPLLCPPSSQTNVRRREAKFVRSASLFVRRRAVSSWSSWFSTTHPLLKPTTVISDEDDLDWCLSLNEHQRSSRTWCFRPRRVVAGERGDPLSRRWADLRSHWCSGESSRTLCVREKVRMTEDCSYSPWKDSIFHFRRSHDNHRGTEKSPAKHLSRGDQIPARVPTVFPRRLHSFRPILARRFFSPSERLSMLYLNVPTEIIHYSLRWCVTGIRKEEQIGSSMFVAADILSALKSGRWCCGHLLARDETKGDQNSFQCSSSSSEDHLEYESADLDQSLRRCIHCLTTDIQIYTYINIQRERKMFSTMMTIGWLSLSDVFCLSLSHSLSLRKGK